MAEVPMAAVTMVVVTMVASLLLAAGCSDDTAKPEGAGANTSGLKGSIVVSAAASLAAPFDEINHAFAAANPGVDVTINYGSSGQLSAQIVEGAPVDVAAFADTTPMESLAADKLLADTAVVFATNRLTIVTKPGNPLKIERLADLATAGVVSLCVETAPCGKFAGVALSSARVVLPPATVSRGQDVKATLAAVTEGDAVAGIVYVTDANAAGSRAEAVSIPDELNVVAEYPIAALADSKNTPLASAFVDFVRSGDGRKLLDAAGFGSP